MGVYAKYILPVLTDFVGMNKDTNRLGAEYVPQALGGASGTPRDTCRMPAILKLHFPLLLIICCVLTSALAQNVRGELQVTVLDPQGAAPKATADLISEANQYRRTFSVNSDGQLVVRDLPFGSYKVAVSAAGFAQSSLRINVQSEVPISVSVRLGVAPVTTAIEVSDSATLVDTQRVGTIYIIGQRAIAEQMPQQAGRELTDLVDEQPGWLYEANGVLHPRGSEYDVQYVVDGLPITQNRSPAFAPAVDPSEIESVRILTASYPAEYGRKLGGIVELTTNKNLPAGWHGELSAAGGSFASANGSAAVSYAEGKNYITGAINGFHTDRYLDPPVLENFSNRANADGFSGSYAHDFSERDRVRISLSHNAVRFLVPSELIQQEAGQRQDITNRETAIQAHFQHVVAPTLLIMASGSLRNASTTFTSNDRSTPVIVSEKRGYREGYGRADVIGHRGHHDWKFGVDTLFGAVHERLGYKITDPTQFDPGTKSTFNFFDHRWDVEPSGYIQDEIHFGNWNVSAGLRFDRYRFAVSQSAWSPRLGIARYIPSLKLLLHASYDRVFQTPAVENLLLASSPQLDSLNPTVVRLPVRPAHANYFELGITTAMFGKLRLDANVFRRDFRDFPDDDVLLDTGVSFPISFSAARVIGEEIHFELPVWKRLSAFVSYANQTGTAHGPITGGLFVGSDAANDLNETTKFAISQDQRNTAHAQLRFQALPRLWLASGTQYGSGLPAETGNEDPSALLVRFGAAILSRVNLDRGRVRPNFALDVAAGAELYRHEKRNMELQIDCFDITDRLNVINFDSVFSGTAVAPRRNVSARLKVSF